MTFTAILALINSVVTAAATAAKSVIEMIPWSNPITWVVLSFIGGCEYGRNSAVNAVNEIRKPEEKPAIVHPFRPWLGVSEAEGGEIESQPQEPFIGDGEELPPNPQDEAVDDYEPLAAYPVSVHTPPTATQSCCGRSVGPVRTVLRRLLRR
jgi:hypothetical protein